MDANAAGMVWNRITNEDQIHFSCDLQRYDAPQHNSRVSLNVKLAWKIPNRGVLATGRF